MLTTLPKYYGGILLKMLLFLFPENKAIKLQGKETIVFIPKGLFRFRRKKFNLVDLLLHYIPKQIAVNKWQSLSLLNYFTTKMISEIKTGIITEEIIKSWIQFLYTESMRIEVMDVGSVFRAYRLPVNRMLAGKIQYTSPKLKINMEKIEEDSLNSNRAFRSFLTYPLNKIERYIQTVTLASAVWMSFVIKTLFITTPIALPNVPVKEIVEIPRHFYI